MIVVIIAIVIVVLDQLSKLWVIEKLKPVIDMPIWDGVLHLHYAENTGAAFSILEGARWFLVGVAIVVTIGVLVYVFASKYRHHKLELITLGMILGGEIGNNIDRIRFGYVVDFVYVKIINFAIFNVADSCIVVGAILLCIYVIFVHDKHIARLQLPEQVKADGDINEPIAIAEATEGDEPIVAQTQEDE